MMKILIIDDEPALRETLRRGLLLAGHCCLTAANSAEALEHLRAHQDVGLVLTDLSMPGKSGLRLIDEIHRVRPSLPVIVITGLAPNPEIEAIRGRGIPVLANPFKPHQLERTIRDHLDPKNKMKASAL